MMETEDILAKAGMAMEEELCDHCLGRLFAQLGHGLTNVERGRTLRIASAMFHKGGERVPVKEEAQSCTLCSDLFRDLDTLVEYVVEESQGIEFDTFLIGSRIDPHIEEKEELLWSKLDLTHSEPLKSEFNRELGKLLDEKLDAEVDLKTPDIKFIVDTSFHSVQVEIAPMFLYSTYRKLSREIPQTRWHCRYCQGTGCQHCGGTGKMYETSVEEIVGEPLLELTGGEDFVLHGMGREDIDALMLGPGRPFVMEVKRPIKRDADLSSLEERVKEDGRVEISPLKRVDKDMVRKIKGAETDKSYRVTVILEEPVEGGKLKKVLQSLCGAEISQRTPKRVSHRRADLVRKRKVMEISLEEIQDNRATIHLTCQAGTYVKEFIHGDEGRTQPNLADELGLKCEVQFLDVVEIHHKQQPDVVK